MNRMLAEMSWVELLEWQAFFKLRQKEAKGAGKPKPGPKGKAGLAKIAAGLNRYQNLEKWHGKGKRR